MRKIAFILNGRAGVGKDTFVDLQKEYAKKKYRLQVSSISTVDKVKEAAKILGWNGVKDSKSRKFLSDLKDLSTEFCDGPAKYCYEASQNLKDDEWIYIHCREPIEIEKMKSFLENRMACFTVLIRRPDVEIVTSNHADMEVDNYSYDFCIDNDSTLEDFAEKAQSFVDKIFYLEEE